MPTKSNNKVYAILLLLAFTAAGCTSIPTKSENFVPKTALYISKSLKVSIGYTLAPGYYVQIGERGDQQFFESSPKADLSFDGPRGFITKAVLVDPHRAVMVKPGKVCVVTVFNAYVCENVLFGEGEIAELRPIPK